MKSRIALFLVAAVLAAPAVAQTSSRAGDMPDYGATAGSVATGRAAGSAAGVAASVGEAPAYPASVNAQRTGAARTAAGTAPGAGDAPAYPQPSVTAAARPIRSFEHRHDNWMTSPN